MIDKRTVTENIKSLLKEKFIIYTDKVNNSLDLKKDLNIENSEMNILLFYLENIFKVEIAQNEEKNIQKVGDLSRIIWGKLNTHTAAA
jgi:acyl carrier protein